MAGIQKLRVTRMDGSRFVLVKPQIRGDSLSGTEARKPSSMLLSKVSAVEAQTVSVARIAGIAVGGFAVLLIAALNSDGYEAF